MNKERVEPFHGKQADKLGLFQGEISVLLRNNQPMQPLERLIIGIDPGTNITGYGIIIQRGRKLELVTHGVIQLGRTQLDHPDKLRKIFMRVSSLVEEFHPDEMALESPYQGKNVQSMLKLGRAQGVAMAAGLMKGLPIAEYAPRKVKQAVTGNGGSSKEQVAAMLKRMFPLPDETEWFDATDGLAVAVCHAYQAGDPSEKGHKDWKSFIEKNPGRVR